MGFCAMTETIMKKRPALMETSRQRSDLWRWQKRISDFRGLWLLESQDGLFPNKTLQGILLMAMSTTQPPHEPPKPALEASSTGVQGRGGLPVFPRETPVKVPAHETTAILKHVALQRSSWGKGLSKSSPGNPGVPQDPSRWTPPQSQNYFQNNPNT